MQYLVILMLLATIAVVYKLSRPVAKAEITIGDAKRPERTSGVLDKIYWAKVFKDKGMQTARVSVRQFNVMAKSENFVANNSGSYGNIKGTYLGQKVMLRKKVAK